MSPCRSGGYFRTSLPVLYKYPGGSLEPRGRGIESEDPDPGEEGAKFLGWLKRNRSAKCLSTCEAKLRHLGLDARSSIESWDQEKIVIVRGRGERIVWLKDLDWADEWARFYGLEVPHHAQMIYTKEKLM